MATVADFTRLGLPPQTLAYDDPTLSAIEFLQAVYHAKHLPMATRIKAARALLPFTEPRPPNSFPPRCTIVIGGLGPRAKSLSPEGTEQINTETQSFSSDRQGNSHPHDGSPGPSNFETTPEPSYVPDYSSPPSPEDLQAIKAVVNKLRPDLAHLPTPEFHLCPCGHWITGTYPCCRERSGGSKLN